MDPVKRKRYDMEGCRGFSLVGDIPEWLFGIAEDIIRDPVNNVYHGFQTQCYDRQAVSLIVLRNCEEAVNLRDKLDMLGAWSQKGNFVKTINIVDLSHRVRGASPVLVTRRFPRHSFVDWRTLRNPHTPASKLFFRKLHSVISEIHEKKGFIGNLLNAVRVEDDRPLIVFPGLNFPRSDADIDAGIRDDIISSRRMMFDTFARVDDYMVPRVQDEDVQLFITMCDVAVPFSRQNLIDASYLIFHGPLVWNTENNFDDFYHFIMALHTYHATDPRCFDGLVADVPGRRCIDLDWHAVFDQRPLTREVNLLVGPNYYTNRRSHFFHSATLLYVLRCVLQHPHAPHRIRDYVHYIYSVFPRAALVLYKMLFEKLFLEHLNPNRRWRMPDPPVEFIRRGEHSFRF